jgi:hypothetical protein
MSDPISQAPKNSTMPPMEEEGSFSLEPNQVVWGVTSTIALIYGTLMYSWYPSDIKSNNILYPTAVGTAVSETWALSTREIKAWKSAS